MPSTTRSGGRRPRERIRSSHVVIVLLGPDTQNAPGVKDETLTAQNAGLRSDLVDAGTENEALAVQSAGLRSDLVDAGAENEDLAAKNAALRSTVAEA